jgi:hypothetical protein
MAEVVAATLPPEEPPSHQPARHEGTGWVVDTDGGPVPVAAPRSRTVAGAAAAAGEHTTEVLTELGIPLP